jgi:hypothetical protein
VLADDVYAGSYLSPGHTGTPIASLAGTDLGEPQLGPMSDWSLSVVTASKTFALPTARVAFAATTSPRLRRAVAHYRTVFSQGRVPQVTELMAAAAICLTPQTWIDHWNAEYRTRLAALLGRIEAINADAGHQAVEVDPPQGGWYVPLRVSRRLISGATSSIDAFAALMHYGEATRDTGIGLLPGELFGYRTYDRGFMLRATLAAPEQELCAFTGRLRDAVAALTGLDGSRIVGRGGAVDWVGTKAEVTAGALLLFGRSQALRRFLSNHEAAVQVLRGNPSPTPKPGRIVPGEPGRAPQAARWMLAAEQAERRSQDAWAS